MFLILPEDKLNKVLNTFNNVHHKIQFTMEREVEGKLPFLDVLVIRKPEGTLFFDWYNKPTSSGRILSYLSDHNFRYKLAVIKGLIHKVLTLSDDEYHKENLNTSLRKPLETIRKKPTENNKSRMKITSTASSPTPTLITRFSLVLKEHHAV